jgi:uncharacterized protein YdeI (YjbR/CyaY-like superfamily)
MKKRDDKAGYPMKTFATSSAWRAWLAKHHATAPGIWIRYFKKHAGRKTVTYQQALEEALCYGWIDSQTQTFDDESYLQKYTPRRARSIWSTRNVALVKRLIKEGRMRPAGQREIDAANKDGRWKSAYSSPSGTVMPADFIAAVGKDRKAKAFFETLNKANTYGIAWRLATAKSPGTRERRFKKLLAMMKRGEKLH